MNVHLPCNVSKAASANGMGRFFSQTNVGRYRRLAGEKIDAAERSRVLSVLAEEWDAFTRECQTPIQFPPVMPKEPRFLRIRSQGNASNKRSA